MNLRKKRKHSIIYIIMCTKQHDAYYNTSNQQLYDVTSNSCIHCDSCMIYKQAKVHFLKFCITCIILCMIFKILI